MPLVAHVIHRLAAGGLENGLVNLINHMPADRYRHAIICLTDFTDFRMRLQRPDVPVLALDKQEGKDPRAYLRLIRVLHDLRPDILHTRSSALDGQLCGIAAGVSGRVHSEHGETVLWRYPSLRRLIQPLVHRYIAVSESLTRWLMENGVPKGRITQVYNGVDCDRFQPRIGGRGAVCGAGFVPDGGLVIGTVGRMQSVKDQLTLVGAFLHLLKTVPEGRRFLRLVLIGDGPLRGPAREMLESQGAGDLAWLPGERADIPEILRALDVFVLPSLSEGTSNTILEAMASGLPVVATRVGGNPELVEEGVTGRLLPPKEFEQLAGAIKGYLEDPELRVRHGQAARQRAREKFSMEAMVGGYLAVYDGVQRPRLAGNTGLV